jgi:hypothetical protein
MSQDIKNEIIEPKFKVSVNYGLSYNPQMDYSRNPNKKDGFFEPIIEPTGTIMFQKNKIGRVYGLGLSYYLNELNSIELAVDQTESFGKYKTAFFDGVSVTSFDEFRLRESLTYHQLIFKNSFKKDKLQLGLGLFFEKSTSQTVSIDNAIRIEERKRNELGIVGAVDFVILKGNNIEFVIKSKTFYTISLALFESIYVAPSLKVSI